MRMQITKRMMEHAVTRLNEVMETKPLFDEYSLYGAYGGWQLVRRNGPGQDAISNGFRPKRDIYDFITAMIYGVQSYKDKQEARKFDENHAFLFDTAANP